MIGYKISSQDLADAVDKVARRWRVSATKRTDKCRAAKKYLARPKGNWSDIKPVFMDLQRNKCAYCERQLEASIEFDIEHYRPKNAVIAWPPTDKPPVAFPTGGDFPEGYYLLAYNLGNYAVACKPCNSNLKASYFPIAGQRVSGSDDPALLAGELRLLIFPIGDQVDAPQELIRFDGHIPVPVNDDPIHYDYHRAKVTIDFFELDIRRDLVQGRCEIMCFLFAALSGAESNSDFARYVTHLTSSLARHANCARCFEKLFNDDRQMAEALAGEALVYLESLPNVFCQM